MSDSSRFYLAVIFAALNFVAFSVVTGMWIVAERRNAADWHSEMAERQAFEESMKRQLSTHGTALQELRTDLSRARVAVQAASADLRNDLAEQRALVENLRNQPSATPPVNPPIVLEPLGFRQNQIAHGRAWGPEQATGEPDTFVAGDMQTAWASRTQDEMNEWLILDYAEAVNITHVKVYETYNPGALSKISVFDEKGQEIEVWKGIDPTPINAQKGISDVTLATPRKSKRIKIYLNSMDVPGWNEIDAVGIVDDAQKTHWATGATASSTFAEPGGAIEAIPVRPKRFVPDLEGPIDLF